MHTKHLLGLITAATLLLSACGDDNSSGSAPIDSVAASTTAPPTPPTSAATPETTIVSTTEGVGYYPACGNETLTFDGVTWYVIAYPDFGAVDPMFAEQWDEISSVTRESSPVFGPSGFVRVAEPGPGDDVGTLVLWSDDVARWVSDSGNLDVWLVQNELEVLWVC